MKRLTFTATLLVLLSMAGAHAQSARQLTKQFPAIEKKELDLKYLGSDSSSVMERINSSGEASRFLQNHEKSGADQEKAEKFKATMPVMQPDSSIRFPMLALIPDPSIRYYMQLKKPE